MEIKKQDQFYITEYRRREGSPHLCNLVSVYRPAGACLAKAFWAATLSLEGIVLSSSEGHSSRWRAEQEALKIAGFIPKEPEKHVLILSTNSDVMGGDVCVGRTRITMAMVLGLMDAGLSNDKIIINHPSLDRADIRLIRKFHADYILGKNCQTEE